MISGFIVSARLHMSGSIWHIVNGWGPGLVLIGWTWGFPNVMLMLVRVLLGFGFLSIVETNFNLLPLHMPGGSLWKNLSLAWIHPFHHYGVLWVHWCRILLWRLNFWVSTLIVSSPLTLLHYLYPVTLSLNFVHLHLVLVRWKEFY